MYDKLDQNEVVSEFHFLIQSKSVLENHEIPNIKMDVNLSYSVQDITNNLNTSTVHYYFSKKLITDNFELRSETNDLYFYIKS